MSVQIDVAVVGATRLVGEALVEALEERDFPLARLHLLDSGDAVGQALPFRGRNLRVGDQQRFDFGEVRLVFLVEERDATCRERAVAAGCLLVDLSASRPLDEQPCVVAQVNAGLLAAPQAPLSIASPQPEAVALAIALEPIKQLMQLQRVTVTACLPVSSRGRAGVGELARQTTELLNARPLQPRLFGRQIAFNLLAQTDDSDPQGHTRQERRLQDELRQLLALPDLAVSVTFVQVPVFFGESLVVSLLGRRAVDVAALSAALEAAPGLELAEAGDYPSAVEDAVGQDVIHVARLRRGLSDPCEVNLWIVSDNVRKGAALNAVHSGELLIKRYL